LPVVLAIVSALLGALIAALRPRANLIVEILVLRHHDVRGRIADGERLEHGLIQLATFNEERQLAGRDVDLANVVAQKAIVRLRDGKLLRVELREDDLHDMRLPVKHGGSRRPTVARLNEQS
jgi:hypothetical protein